MKAKWFPPWAVIMLLVLAIGTVWLRLSIVRITYEINQSKKMILNAQHEMDRLELEVARLRSPRHLEKLARSKFQLSPPRASQVVYLQRKSR